MQALNDQHKKLTLQKLYEDPAFGLVAADKFWKKIPTATKKELNLTFQEVREFLAELESVQRHSMLVPTPQQYHIVAFYQNHLWQMDIMFPHGKYSKDEAQNSDQIRMNDNIVAVLMIVDVYSRFAWAFPLKSKRATEVAAKLRTLFRSAKPDIIQTDSGGEYAGAVATLLAKNGIQHNKVAPGEHTRLGIVDSFTRTLRLYIERFKTITQKPRFIDKLDEFLANYNSTFHSELRARPQDVYRGEIGYTKINIIKHNIPIGKTVRYRLNRSIFEKGTKARWSDDVFSVDEYNGVRYKLSNGISYMERELQVVEEARVSRPARRYQPTMRDQFEYFYGDDDD
jgi:hypothetical protein